MGQHPSHPSPPPGLLRPPAPRRTSSSLRQHRKRSLELPEFAALTNNHHLRAAPLNIPMAASVIQQPPSPPHQRQHYFPPQPIHITHPQKIPQEHQQPQPQPQQPPRPQPTRAASSQPPSLPTVQEDAIIVRSRLPLGLNPQDTLPLQELDDPEGTQEATITWRGPGKEVYLTSVADSSQRVKMVHEPGSKTTFFTTVRLPPGNHPLRFLVDDQPRCTDTLPTATDTDGQLVNYIEILSPSTSPVRSRPGSGVPALASTAPGGKTFPEMEWTGIIPPRLFKLAAEEEAYLAARAAAQSSSSSGGPRTHPQRLPPLPPPPPVPYPPSLPRHLEKVILNNTSSTRNQHHPPIALTPTARPRITGERSTGKGMLHGSAPIPAVEGTGDDNSVLPVPNHVVLNHLGTSAIKNGVLAVGTTTRYHRKYISTIYYKPVSSYSS